MSPIEPNWVALGDGFGVVVAVGLPLAIAVFAIVISAITLLRTRHGHATRTLQPGNARKPVRDRFDVPAHAPV